MENFTTSAATTAAAPDPAKHVNYSYGMVLGVDDLTQEFAYHAARDRWMMRDAVGYGTLSGLHVAVGKDKNNEAEVTVDAGTALSPRGQLIRVGERQCADIVKWLAFAKNRDAIRDRVHPLPGWVKLYVVLCYRDCPTDNVPVPGEPCRTESEATAPSRLRDDFKLELRFDAPDQEEEDALRDFAKWLNSHVTIKDTTNTQSGVPTPDREIADRETTGGGTIVRFATLAEFIEGIRHAAATAPQSPPDFMFDSSATMFSVHPQDACQFMRAALRLWVTELRPRWRPDLSGANGTDAANSAQSDDCVLLAELDVPLDASGRLDTTKQIVCDEERRPFLLHLRMLQELLSCGGFERVVVSETPPSFPLPSPVPSPPPPRGGGGEVEESILSRLRVPQTPDEQSPTSPPSPDERTVATEARRIILSTPDAQGTAQPPASNASASVRALPKIADLTVAQPVTDVVRPLPGNDGAQLLPLVTILRLDGGAPVFRLWFHLDAPSNDASIVSLDDGALTAFGELVKEGRGGNFLEQIKLDALPADERRNVFDVKLELDSDVLRFVFDPASIKVDVGGNSTTLADFAKSRNIRFIGQNGAGGVTAFAPMSTPLR
jgi:hypothetical protein